MGIVLNKIKELQKSNPQGWHQLNTEWFMKEIQNQNSEWFPRLTVRDIKPGKFYFLFYDLSGNFDSSSKLMQFSPILALKTGILENKPILWALNWNFIPPRVTIEWFDRIIERFFYRIYTEDLNQDFSDQRKWPLTYEGVYRTLAGIGFEWAIREYRLDAINDVRGVHMEQLHRFLSYDTEQFTNVDVEKLVQIWRAKLDEGNERMRQLKRDLIKDFKMLRSEIDTSSEAMREAMERLNSI